MRARRGWRRLVPEGLPRLTGWRWRVFLLVWIAALVPAIASALMGLPSLVTTVAPSPSEQIGVTFDLDQGYPLLGPPIGSAARTSGIRRGDRVVAVDGRAVAPSRSGFDRQVDGAVGDSLVLTTLSPSGDQASHRLTRDPGHLAAALSPVGLTPMLARTTRAVVVYLGDAILPLACAIILMVRRARDRLAPWASLMMLALLLGLGGGTAWFGHLFNNSPFAFMFFNAVGFGMLVVVLSVFPEGRFDPPWSLAVAVLGTLGVIVSEPLPAAESNAFLLLAQFAAVAAIAVRYRRMAPGTGRQQIRWALLGFAASIVALALLILLQFVSMLTNDYGLLAWSRIGESLANIALTGLLLIGITVSLLRYRLYDADVAISRSIVYGTLTVSLLAIFAGSEKVIEILGEQYFGESIGALAGGLGAAIAAVMIAPIHHRVTHWAEHRFRSGLAHLRQGLPLLVSDLRETATTSALADAMLVRVEKGVRARHGAVVVGDAVLDARDIEAGEVATWLTQAQLPAQHLDRLDCDRADPLFPMRVPLHGDDIGLVGWLLLGPRPDGSFYGREERAALHEIAGPVARALAVALAHERRDAERRQRDQARDREIARLRGALDRLQSWLGFDAPPSGETA